MKFQAALEYFESLIDYERTVTEARNARFFNLARMEQLLAKLGNPEQGRNFVHIAGTKGKGSTAAMTAAMAQAAGYRVGLYTSPHLISFRERIRINGELISEGEVGELAEMLVAPIESLRGSESGTPSFFEAYTALALLYFAQEKVELAVMETGLGGRLDATNVISLLCCGITTIALDHTVELGDTLSAIAGEKAGIIKPGVPVVCSPQQPEAMAVIAKVSREKGAPLYKVGDGDGNIYVQSLGIGQAQKLSIRGLKSSYEAECALLGEHQAQNAGVAVGLAELLSDKGFAIGPEAIQTGLERVRWPGRLQIVPGEPPIVLDGAHDVASARALCQSLVKIFPGKKIVFVLGIAKDKNLTGIIGELLPAAEAVIVTAAKSPRSASPEELQEICRRHFPQVSCDAEGILKSALGKARAMAGENGIVAVTGSLYLVGEAMELLGVKP
jgi:dihydrofolate synthase/folylpolyglutamate synthase